MKKVFIFTHYLLLCFISDWACAHHYKGLPHNSYFENYPQVPTLEFLHEDDKWEIFLTVFNFQGINLDNVQNRDMLRLYIFLYDVKNDNVYRETVKMEILSRGRVVYSSDNVKSEEENIYSIHQELKYQDDLELHVYFKAKNNEIDLVKLPFKITKSFFEKYGLGISIFIFFIIVGILKKYFIKLDETSNDKNT